MFFGPRAPGREADDTSDNRSRRRFDPLHGDSPSNSSSRLSPPAVPVAALRLILRRSAPMRPGPPTPARLCGMTYGWQRYSTNATASEDKRTLPAVDERLRGRREQMFWERRVMPGKMTDPLFAGIRLLLALVVLSINTVTFAG